MGKKPDDLRCIDNMAIASPAITINRTYQNYCKKGQSFQSYLPSQIAKIFINCMIKWESTATVELACERNLMMRIKYVDYCKHGNILLCLMSMLM